MRQLNFTKTTIRVHIFIILSLICSVGYGQMRQIHLENTEGAEISRLCFYSQSEGYAAFRDWLGYTSDSGRTFTRKYITPANVNFNGYSPVNLTFGFQILGVKAFSQSELLTWGSYGLVPAILRSVDGGNTFTLVFHSQFNSQQLSTGITDMIFPQNSATGYAIDADRILKTTNRGLSWSVIRTVPGSFYTNLEGFDDFHIYAMSTSNNTLQYTDVAGLQWYYIHPGQIVPNGRITYAYFLNANLGWMSVYVDNDKQYFYKTINAGSSWTLQNNATATGFNADKFKFIDQNTGYALSGQNTVYKTGNSGATWEPLARDNQFTYLGYTHNDLQCWTADRIWAGGGQGLLELNTNASSSTIPQAYFNIDTAAAGLSVDLINFSLAGYSYQWFVNSQALATSYHTSYLHDIYRGPDTIRLVVSNGIYSDTTVKIQTFNAVPYPPPVISSFTPASGPAGTLVTIQGNFFAGVQSVSFGGIPAASFTVQSLTTISAIVGAGGNGAVSVTTPRGMAILAGFSMYPPPVIYSLSPLSGPVGSTLVITGNNFSSDPSANIVYIGGIKAIVSAATGNQLSVIVPAGTTQMPVSVTVNGHTGYSASTFMTSFTAPCNFSNYTFAKAENFDISHTTHASATADLNNDGRPDLISATSFGVIVSKNVSTTLRSQFEVGPLMRPFTSNSIIPSLQIADLNGDGRLDIAITDNIGGKVSVFKNLSTGSDISFAERVDFNAGVNPQSLVAEDLDMDGKIDLAFLNRQSSKDSISILRNTSINGYINFAEKQSTFTFQPVVMVINDMNADGKRDLVVLQNSSALGNFRIHQNTSVPGIISFGTAQGFPPGVLGASINMKVADIDNDGRADVVVAFDLGFQPEGGVTIFRNTGSSTALSFTEHRITVLDKIGAIELDDIDGDGKIDLFANCGFYSTLTLFKNRSIPGSIDLLNVGTIPSTSWLNFRLTDINTDGKPDVIYPVGSLGNIAVTLNTLNVKGGWAGRDTTICASQQLLLGSPASIGTGTPSGHQFAWSSQPAGFSSALGNPPVTPAATTSYFVRVTDPFGCVMYDTIKVTIGGPLPGGPGIPLNQFGCTGDSIQINNPPVAGYSYTWTSSSSGYTSNLANPAIPILSGYRYYTLETNTGFCITRQNLTLQGVALPVANAGPDRTICIGSTTSIGSSGNSSFTYAWSATDPGYTSNLALTSVQPVATTSYYLKQTGNSTGCIGRDTVLVTVLARPIADAGPDKTICGSDSVTIGTPALPGHTYQWRSPGGPLLSTNAMINVRPAANTQYFVRASNGGCTVADTMLLTIYPGIPVINITASDTSLCPGNIIPVQFNASIGVGGLFTYQWKRNGANVGSGLTSYLLNDPQHGDTVYVVITGNIGCSELTTVTSKKLIIRVESRWTGPQYGSWNIPSNWSCGFVPDSTMNVVIPAGSIVNINSNATCKSIRILQGATVNVWSGFVFTVLN